MRQRQRPIRRFRLGPIDVATVPPDFIDRVIGTRTWRRLVEPVLRRLRGGRSPASAPPLVRSSRDGTAVRSEPSEVVRELVERVREHSWYHTMDLGHGVLTPGFVDHRLQLPYYDLPESLEDVRCLDIATFDGFWAFEFERRGSSEVVALDVPDRSHLDFPRWMSREPAEFKLTGRDGGGFALAHDVYGSQVTRVEKSVYDLDPAEDGLFDLIFISDVLVHLRDPQLAIERAYSVSRGEIVIADVYSPAIDGLGDVPLAEFLGPGESWWKPNVACLRQMMTVAGFEPVEEVSRFRLAAVDDDSIHKVVLRGIAAQTPSWTIEEKRHRAGWRR